MREHPDDCRSEFHFAVATTMVVQKSTTPSDNQVREAKELWTRFLRHEKLLPEHQDTAKRLLNECKSPPPHPPPTPRTATLTPISHIVSRSHKDEDSLPEKVAAASSDVSARPDPKPRKRSEPSSRPPSGTKNTDKELLALVASASGRLAKLEAEIAAQFKQLSSGLLKVLALIPQELDDADTRPEDA